MLFKWQWMIMLSLGTALTVAGCGSGPSTATKDAQNQAATSQSQNGSASASDVLKIGPGVSGDFQNVFNPFQSSMAPGTNGLIYESLFYFNPVGSQQYGLLASSYKWSNGNKTLTVQLRHNVTWTDGKRFTAKDVTFTFDLLKKYPATDTNGIWNQLTSISAQGDYEVTFHFKQPNVPFAWYILGTPIVPEHIWSGLGDPTKAVVQKPVGTGPYELSSFSPQVIKYQANNAYYLGRPRVKTVEMLAYASNDAETMALVKRDVDWSGIFIPNIDSVYTSKDPNNRHWFPPNDVVMLYANLNDPLLKQLPVREAISLGINRQELVQKAEDGYVDVASPTGLVLPNNQDWVDPKLKNTKFTYDPKKAVQILEKAGFKKNSQGIVVSPSGQELSFTLQIVPGWSDWNTACSLIASQLRNIGINVQVQGEQAAAYTSNLTNHKFQLAVSWTVAGPSPYYLYKNLLGSNGGWNIEQWKDSGTDKVLQDFAATTNKGRQTTDIYSLEHLMVDKLPAIPLFYGVHWSEYNDKQFKGWPNANNPYANPAPYEWPGPAIVLMHLKPAD
ncbi:MAG: ABC transporter substrate-binding protein [Alicyclobacillus herbarius]|uniref:ABC transporter substrate-binding protein n=1 Tax=Alicyclobacillus herbarius TaxID=122960 RepID=UPI002355FED3|nr:ABC transporter substrate-binding protein [Alicyclobacillus herbarius]MCL6633199.1 ABC transporter substrate-binding protein [Alicyclobacillus herbarius]